MEWENNMSEREEIMGWIAGTKRSIKSLENAILDLSGGKKLRADVSVDTKATAIKSLEEQIKKGKALVARSEKLLEGCTED